MLYNILMKTHKKEFAEMINVSVKTLKRWDNDNIFIFKLINISR